MSTDGLVIFWIRFGQLGKEEVDENLDEERDGDDELLMGSQISKSPTVAPLDLQQSWHHTSQIPKYFENLHDEDAEFR